MGSEVVNMVRCGAAPQVLRCGCLGVMGGVGGCVRGVVRVRFALALLRREREDVKSKRGVVGAVGYVELEWCNA